MHVLQVMCICEHSMPYKHIPGGLSVHMNSEANLHFFSYLSESVFLYVKTVHLIHRIVAVTVRWRICVCVPALTCQVVSSSLKSH